MEKLAGRLQRARKEKNVTPEVASEDSGVPVRYVRMFEEGRYPVVSDPAYLAHFVRRYATYLGLDAEQASRDLIAETEPETALRRAGKLAAGAKVEPSMTIQKESGPQGKDDAKKSPKTGSAKPASKAPARRFRFDAGPISIIGAVVTFALFLLTLRAEKKPTKAADLATQQVVHSEVAAAATAAPAPPPAPTSPPVETAPAPAAEPAPPAAAPPAPAPPPPAPPPQAPAAAAPAAIDRPVAAAPPPKPVAPAKPAAAAKAAEPSAGAKAASPHAATSGAARNGEAGGRKTKIDATNRASDALRTEQLERMKTQQQGGAGSTAPPPADKAPAPTQ